MLVCHTHENLMWKFKSWHCVMSCMHSILGLPHSVHNTTQCALVGPPRKCSWHPLWVALAACATPPDVPLLAYLSCAHMTYMVPLQVCTAHATPSTTCTWGCTTFPSTPVIFPHLHMTLQHSTLGSDLQHTQVHILSSLLPLVHLIHTHTQHHTVALWVWFAAHTHEGAQHSLACPHWLTPGMHTTLHSAPVGLA